MQSFHDHHDRQQYIFHHFNNAKSFQTGAFPESGSLATPNEWTWRSPRARKQPLTRIWKALTRVAISWKKREMTRRKMTRSIPSWNKWKCDANDSDGSWLASNKRCKSFNICNSRSRKSFYLYCKPQSTLSLFFSFCQNWENLDNWLCVWVLEE